MGTNILLQNIFTQFIHFPFMIYQNIKNKAFYNFMSPNLTSDCSTFITRKSEYLELDSIRKGKRKSIKLIFFLYKNILLNFAKYGKYFLTAQLFLVSFYFYQSIQKFLSTLHNSIYINVK